MVDKWNGLADMLANLIEKYVSDLDIDSLPDITVDNYDKMKEIEHKKIGRMFLANNDCTRYNKYDKYVQTILKRNKGDTDGESAHKGDNSCKRR